MNEKIIYRIYGQPMEPNEEFDSFLDAVDYCIKAIREGRCALSNIDNVKTLCEELRSKIVKIRVVETEEVIEE